MAENAGRSIAGVFHFSVMCTMLLILLNMLIAVILDVYGETKKSASYSETIWEDVIDYFHRWWLCHRGLRMSISRAKAIYAASLEEKPTQECGTPSGGESTPELKRFESSIFTENERKAFTLPNITFAWPCVSRIHHFSLDQVPEMSLEQATESVEEAVFWFEKRHEWEIDHQQMQQGPSPLRQRAAGIDLHAGRKSLILEGQTPLVPDVADGNMPGEVAEGEPQMVRVHLTQAGEVSRRAEQSHLAKRLDSCLHVAMLDWVPVESWLKWLHRL
ncbi:Polycystin-2 [Durusdinium trenchii]|uniref:Polycystin-2 n=1 Tax=Durusdinium trenchii TaxID=1381693 RepID=A0ABP0IT63_9DINO